MESADSTKAASRPTLSVVVPTYREAANVPVLFERLKTALDGLPWEMIVVDDDSPDGTYDVAFAIAAARSPHALPQARQSLRPRRRRDRGLAVLERRFRRRHRRRPAARRSASCRTCMPRSCAARANSSIGTRVPDEATPGGLSPARQKLSDLGAWFFRASRASRQRPDERLLHDAARDRRRPRAAPVARRLQDPRRSRPVLGRPAEDRRIDLCVPQEAGGRIEAVAARRPRFLGLVMHHASRGVLPTRFVLFALIGAVGLFVHFAVLWALIARLRRRRFRLRADRRDDRGDGEQFRAQQRDHLPLDALSRARR